MVKISFRTYPMGSREKAEKRRGRVYAAIRLDHVRSVGGQGRGDGEDVFRQLSDEIMHWLWVGTRRKRRSKCIQLT